MSAEAVKTGWLVKCARVSGWNWKRRWIEVYEKKLMYYVQPGTPPKGTVFFSSKMKVEEKASSKSKYPHCLVITTGHRLLGGKLVFRRTQRPSATRGLRPYGA